MKKIFYTELAYVIYLKISQYYSWFTFGMAEYCFQAFLIIILSITMLKFKRKYLFSFVTAFIYGNILDISMLLVGLIPEAGYMSKKYPRRLVMSFAFFGLFVFQGVKIGTVICAVVNGWLIGKCSFMLEKLFEFKDAMELKDKGW